MRDLILPVSAVLLDERTNIFLVVGIEMINHPADTHQRDRAMGNDIASEAAARVFSEMGFQIEMGKSLRTVQTSHFLLIVNTML